MGAVHKALLRQNASLEGELKHARAHIAELQSEREALNAYVTRMSDWVRNLQQRLRRAGLDASLGGAPNNWRSRPPCSKCGSRSIPHECNPYDVARLLTVLECSTGRRSPLAPSHFGEVRRG